ncbi:unnamed protein product [Rotaria sordida]|uniref:Uncharacterized protein n=2 Tax=Rotaria sordida TaxID=392033 RepID=A0A818VUN2_9BILA|nr:unnamed protein product [Rotaria sordida]
MAHDWNKISAEDVGFDENKWEALINSDEVFTEQFSKSINTIDISNFNMNKKDIVKLSVNSFKKSTFIDSDKFIHTGRTMTILIPPCSNQRVRYENECEKILRYLSIPNKRTMTIEIPDLRDTLTADDAIWMRIARTTIDHRKDNLIFYHPYPTWIKDKNARIHKGSIYIQITNRDMENGFIEMDTLALIRLKQDDLAQINTLGIYSRTQLNFFDLHSIDMTTPKCTRDEYRLRQSILNFQLVRVDQNNIAYLTDCFCQTESIHETEVFHYAYNDNEFNDLDAGLSLRSTSQVTNNEHNIDVDNYLQRLLDELLTTSNVDEVSDKNYDSGAASLLTPSYYLDEPLFPDCQLEDICGDPINEVAITTTTTNTENNNNNYMVNNASSELNSNEYENRTSDEIKNLIKQSFDDFNLQFIDNSIEQRTMLIETPPPAKFRYRYKSDTKHYIEKSRTKPMVIKLPDLKGIKLNSNQLFWLRLILTTYSENPLDEVYLHVNQLKYHSNDIHELDDKTICIPLTLTDIEEGKKALSCLSIIKTTLNNYMSRLIPFNLTRINNESYENTNEKISIPEAKKIFKKFNLKASRIVCQLVIKQNEFWHFTNITCQTKGIEDKEQKNTTKKRSAETNDSDEDERPSSSKSKSIKRKKRSHQ